MQATRETVLRNSLVYLQIFTLISVQAIVAEEKTPYIPEHHSLAAFDAKKKVDVVLFLMQKRLSLTHEVARTAWLQNKEIEDPIREQIVLKKICKTATAYGLKSSWAEKFFQAQIEAGKMIQAQDFAYWKDEGEVNLPKSLRYHQELRPYIDCIDKELIQALVEIYPLLESQEIATLVLQQPLSSRDTDYVDEEVWQQAISPFSTP